nr:phenylalanine--tRNA ligase subunit beta [Saprospiraceae bacterium]
KNLLTVSSRNQLSVSEISKYPTVERDLAIILDESVKFDEVEKLAKSIDKQLIKEVSLFDIYRNDEQIGKNKKSYAINIKFEDKEKTLNDKEVDKKMSKMISTFENKLEASIRK